MIKKIICYLFCITLFISNPILAQKDTLLFSKSLKIHASLPEYSFLLQRKTGNTENTYLLRILDTESKKLIQEIHLEVYNEIGDGLYFEHYSPDDYLDIRYVTGTGPIEWSCAFLLYNPATKRFRPSDVLTSCDPVLGIDSTLEQKKWYGGHGGNSSTFKWINGQWIMIKEEDTDPVEFILIVDEKDTMNYLDRSGEGYEVNNEWELVNEGKRIKTTEHYFIPRHNYYLTLEQKILEYDNGSTKRDVKLIMQEENYLFSSLDSYFDSYQFSFNNETDGLIFKTLNKGEIVNSYFYQFKNNKLLFMEKK